MQKISSYLYPNRIEVIINLAGFTVEFTSVYQRNIKIYNGIDNIIEFDIKNADQKRIDLSTLNLIELHVMDASGNALPNSPYLVIPVENKKGIAKVIIPQSDLNNLSSQFLKYSMSVTTESGDTMMAYTNTYFNGVGVIELVGSAMPTTRKPMVYKSFTGEIDFSGNVVYHSSSIPATFYESIPTPTLSFSILITGFIGKVWLEATTNSTISVNSYLHATKLAERNLPTATTSTITFNDINVSDFKYFRILYQGNSPINPTGTVDKVTVL